MISWVCTINLRSVAQDPYLIDFRLSGFTLLKLSKALYKEGASAGIGRGEGSCVQL